MSFNINNYGTAKTYANWEKLGEPFQQNFKWYIRVKDPKSSTEKIVRAYSSAELHKMYPDFISITNDKWYRTQKEVLGFDKGYITIFKGDSYKNLEWFQESICRYHKIFGWYCVSTEEIPENLPADLTPIILKWELVGDENGKLFSDDKVAEAIESLIYDESPSKFQGTIGERIEITVTVKSVSDVDSKYGKATLHVFVDDDGNEYVWATTAKSWEVGSVHHLRGTVKSHAKFHNIATTYLTRCTEVKEA